jgi:streptogramin lyase
LLSYHPAKGQFSTFPLPEGGAIDALTVDGAGKVVFTIGHVGKLGLFDPGRGAFITFDGLPGGSRPAGVVVDAKGSIWFTDLVKNSLVKVDGEAVSQLWTR